MELHKKILDLRKANGMTQDDLAKALFVSRQSVYKWESGKALPDIEMFKQICELFQVSADELLELESICSVDVPQPEAKPEKATEKESAKNALKNHRHTVCRYLFPIAALCLLVLLGLVALQRKETEIKKAGDLGIVPAELQRELNQTISEKDFLTMQQRIADLQGNTDILALTKAAETATNEQLTREKAAYWLYCTHIWVTRDSTADLSIETHTDPDPITQRDVYQDLNTLSQKSVDALATPWERVLCRELDETAALFDIYDGTPQMDEEINAILYGPYYTAVIFCTAQESFLNERTLLECTNDEFRAKEKITVREAIIATYRLYGSW